MTSPHPSHVGTMYSQPPEQTQYDSGLIPAGDYYAKQVVSPQQQSKAYMGNVAHAYAPPPEEKKIFGLRKTTFWLTILSIVLAAGLVGASVAAGILASQNNGGGGGASESNVATTNNDDTSSSSAPSSSSTPSSSTSPSASGAFTAIAVPTRGASGLGFTAPKCPGVDGEDYTVPGSSIKFTRECNNNYPGNDLGNLPMTTMEDCMALCASQWESPQSANGPCVGVVWHHAGRQGNDNHACWLKFGKGSGQSNVDDTESAWIDQSASS